MSWEKILKEDNLEDAIDLFGNYHLTPSNVAEFKSWVTTALNGYNKASDAIYGLINPLENIGVLEEEDILSFTKIIDEIEKKIKDADSEIKRKIKGE